MSDSSNAAPAVAETATSAEDEAKAQKLAERNLHKGISVHTLMEALAVNTVQSQNFIIAGEKRAAVKNKLVHYLQTMWIVGSEFDLPATGEYAQQNPDILRVFYTVSDKGIKWNTIKLKGSVVWSTIADLFCKAWWDPEKNKPVSIPS
jgi:hypothetical protein